MWGWKSGRGKIELNWPDFEMDGEEEGTPFSKNLDLRIAGRMC